MFINTHDVLVGGNIALGFYLFGLVKDVVLSVAGGLLGKIKIKL